MPVHVSQLIRSKRRTIALIVERDGSLTVRAPLRMSTNAIDEFVQKHLEWVEKKRLEMQSMAPAKPPRRYDVGELFLYMGQHYPLETVTDAKQKLVLDGSFKLSLQEHRNAEIIFRNWYRRQAATFISQRVVFFAKQHEIEVNSLRITSARTRWGSCSAKGALSFSWRLMMTPPHVIDYVVVHELAHTIHHDHSARFWKLVEKWMPDYRERRKQLRQYGHESI